MQVWLTLMLVLQMLAAIAMIGLVLVQQGKGADMGASFGGGSSGSLFGATGSANFLSRSTAACATVFFVATLGLAFMSNVPRDVDAAAGTSVLDRAAPAASAPAEGVIPGAAPVTPAAVTPSTMAAPMPASEAAPSIPKQ